MHALDVQGYGMFKPIIRMAAAAIIAGLVVFATSAAPKANVPDDNRALPQASAKGDRLPLHLKGAACSKHGWPNFEKNCQFDLRNPADEARTVRVIALR
jgi:hypothetical protein